MNEEAEDQYRLGPFFDIDAERSEIIPLGFEESLEPLLLCVGAYSVRSNEPSLQGTEVHIFSKDVTEFIQADWDRVFGPIKPNRGFLLAYHAGAFAAGRVAEELVLRKLLISARLLAGQVVEYLLFTEAMVRGLVVPRRGSQSDDLVLLLDSGKHIIIESKAAFSGRSYLRRSIPKAIGQLAATMGANGELSSAALCLIDLKNHSIAFASMTREEVLGCGQILNERVRGLMEATEQPRIA